MTNKRIDDINKYLLNDKRHIFYFEKEVNIDTAKPICKELLFLDIRAKEDIFLYLNCYGGLEEGGLAIIDTMQSLRSKVTTIICGTACSMAAIISICGHKRWAYPNASWMMHDSSFEYNDYLSKIKDRIRFDEYLTNVLYKIIKQKTDLIDKEIKRFIKGEIWLNSEQMLEKGVIDKII